MTNDSKLTIGIFGGGQLGQMLCNAAHKLGFKTVVFSDVAKCPASLVCNQVIVANYLDEKALNEFASQIDIATFEFENIPTKAVDFVTKIKPVFPNSNVLRITQNRLKEKDFLNQIGVKTTDYLAISSLEDLKNGFKKFNSKCVLKTTTMGYDGKGQKVLTRASNLEEVWQELSGQELILEKFADFTQEISVIAARSQYGTISCYQPLTNIHKDGILDKSIYPAQISQKITSNAVKIASKIIEELNLIGLLAVEFFVLKTPLESRYDETNIGNLRAPHRSLLNIGEERGTENSLFTTIVDRDSKGVFENGDLLVNELAPRPHNSGHFSMDASNTSQFEQLIRVIANLPLGNINFHHNGYMQNLIGADVLKAEDMACKSATQNQTAKIHLYGKDKIAEGRKMGHINFLQSTLIMPK